MKRRSSSISPPSRKAPGEVRAALEQHRGDRRVERAELVERRAHAGGLVLAGGDDDLGAGVLERVGVRAPRGARDDDDERHLVGGRDELRVQGQAPGGVEDHAPRLVADAVDARGELRVVGQRGADAHGHGVARGAPAVGDEPAVLAGDPLRVARLGRHLAVEAHGRLEEHPRAPGAGVLAEGLVLLARPRGELAAGEVDLHALVAQDAQAPARGLLGRVVAGDDDAPDAGREDGVGARRLLALVAARLQRDVERGAAAGRRRRRTAIALTSACGPPYSSCQPSPTTRSSLTTTAPTTGLGLTLPTPRSASSMARVRCS